MLYVGTRTEREQNKAGECLIMAAQATELNTPPASIAQPHRNASPGEYEDLGGGGGGVWSWRETRIRR